MFASASVRTDRMNAAAANYSWCTKEQKLRFGESYYLVGSLSVDSVPVFRPALASSPKYSAPLPGAGVRSWLRSGLGSGPPTGERAPGGERRSRIWAHSRTALAHSGARPRTRERAPAPRSALPTRERAPQSRSRAPKLPPGLACTPPAGLISSGSECERTPAAPRRLQPGVVLDPPHGLR